MRGVASCSVTQAGSLDTRHGLGGAHSGPYNVQCDLGLADYTSGGGSVSGGAPHLMPGGSFLSFVCTLEFSRVGAGPECMWGVGVGVGTSAGRWGGMRPCGCCVGVFCRREFGV